MPYSPVPQNPWEGLINEHNIYKQATFFFFFFFLKTEYYLSQGVHEQRSILQKPIARDKSPPQAPHQASKIVIGLFK